MNVEDVDCTDSVKGMFGSTDLFCMGCPVKKTCSNFGQCFQCLKCNKYKKEVE